MTTLRHDRIVPLAGLTWREGSTTGDRVLYLPSRDDRRVRLWLLTAADRPVVRIDEITFAPPETPPPAEQPRWVDLGCGTIHQTHFFQLRVDGITPDQAQASALLITPRLDYDPTGKPLADVERDLWGLARQDLGTTTLSPAEVEVGYAGPFTVRYVNGPVELRAGAELRLAVPGAWSVPQAENPDAPGYVEITGGDVPARVIRVDAPSVESHEKCDAFVRLDEPLRPGGQIEVTYRTDRTYIYPQTFDELERDTWYRKLPPLAVAVACSPDHPPVTPPEGSGHRLTVRPGPVARLHLFLPGRRRAGERLALRGTWTDRFRNVEPTGAIPDDVALELADVEGKPVPLSGPQSDGYRFRIDLPDLPPGVYRARAVRSGEVIAQSNPLEIMTPGDARPCIYWGEIHGHSEMSDGAGAYDELYRHARQDGCLDFAAAADHICYHTDNQWQWMQDVTNRFNDPGRFATLVGYEWAGRQSHRNLYTSRDRLEPIRGMYPPTAHLREVYPRFHGDEEVVAGPHAPLAHGLRWTHHDPAVERFVEIYSMWGASDEHGNDLEPPQSNPQKPSVFQALAQGLRLGFTGGGDCHEGHVGLSCEDPDGQGTTPHTFAAKLLYRCGLTGACMDRLTRRELLAALRDRRTYATTGQRVLLDFAVTGFAMGRIGRADRAECAVTLHAETPIESVEFIRDGLVVDTHQPNTLDATLTWTDPAPVLGEHFYLVRVRLAGGHRAWSSPVWLLPPPPSAT